MSDVRKDSIINRWVILAPERSKRPNEFSSRTIRQRIEPCPFCYGNESLTPPEVYALRPAHSRPNDPDWTLRVVPNKYPAIEETPSGQESRNGLYTACDGQGAHEVIIETHQHDKATEQLSETAIEACFRTYRHRIEAHKDKPYCRYIQLLKNHGEESGATLEHSHTQLISLPIVPDTVQEELTSANAYFDSSRQCIFCHLIEQEQKDNKRLVAENEAFIAFCPFAPRFPYETWIFPRFHSARFETVDPEKLSSLAKLFKDVLMRIRKQLNAPPYNFYLHTAPMQEACDDFFHWHIEVLPKTTRMAGLELSTGCYINPTKPEDAARALRNISID